MSLPFNPDTSVQLPGETTFTSSTDKTNLSEWTKSGINLYNSALGNVSIGTTSTIYKLNVNGSINFVTLYENGNLIDFTLYATKSLLTSGLATKQDKINAYVLSTGSIGSLGFLAGTLTLVLPNNYSSLSISSLTTDTSFIYKGTELSTSLNAKQPNINTYTITGGTGGSLSFASATGTLTLAMPNNYTTNMSLSNLITPTSFIYKGTELSTSLNAKEAILTFNSPLTRTINAIGIDLSSYYTQTQTNTAITNTSNYATNISNILTARDATNLSSSSNYALNISNILKANIDTKEAILSFTAPLTRTTNTIGINLGSYSTTGTDTNYLLKTGGIMTGALTTPNITLGGTSGKINVVDDYHYIDFNQSTDTTTIQEYGTIKFNIGVSKTTKAYVNASGLTATAFYGDGANITDVPYSTITGKPNYFPIDPAIYYNQTQTNNLLNAKEAILTFNTPLTRTTNAIGIDLSAYYNKTETNGLITNTSNYALNISNILKTNIDTNNTNTSNYASNISNVLWTNVNTNFLKLSGGSMTGQITGVTTLNGTTGIFGTLATTNNTNTGTPGTGPAGGNGDKIILYPGGVGVFPYSIGIDANNLWYSATTGASHNFYIGGGNPKMTILSNGNVGIGTSSPGVNLHLYASAGNNAIQSLDASAGSGLAILRLISGNGSTNRGTFLDFYNNVASTTYPRWRIVNDYDYNGTNDLRIINGNIQSILTILQNGNVGINVLNPSAILQVGNGGRLKISNGTDDWSTLGSIDNDGPLNTRIVVSGNTRAAPYAGCIEYLATGTGAHIFYSINPGYNERMRIDTNGNVSLTGNLSVQSQLIYNYLFNNTGGIHGDITNFDNITHFGYKFINGLTNGPAGFTYPSYYSWFIGLGSNYPATGANSYGCQFAVPRNTTNPYLFVRYKENNVWGSWYSTRALTAQKATELESGDQWIFGNLTVTEKITCKLTTTTNQNPHDYVGVPFETNSGATASYTLQLILNSFTGYHRNFTNDELFDENDAQLFKDTYEGRIVVATGKIATQIGNQNDGYDIQYDKDGIFVEDSHPLIQLSRKKKQKSVFGVLGRKDRKNTNEKRMIVNSIGEGAIWVCNSNGNIENGDYITSSDYLGYGEKQDDDLLHNYTVAKATMDCDFQLDSSLYNCIELDDGLRVAFVAATYHCG